MGNERLVGAVERKEEKREGWDLAKLARGPGSDPSGRWRSVDSEYWAKPWLGIRIRDLDLSNGSEVPSTAG